MRARSRLVVARGIVGAIAPIDTVFLRFFRRFFGWFQRRRRKPLKRLALPRGLEPLLPA
jgi:hypothetical protein